MGKECHPERLNPKVLKALKIGLGIWISTATVVLMLKFQDLQRKAAVSKHGQKNVRISRKFSKNKGM